MRNHLFLALLLQTNKNDNYSITTAVALSNINDQININPAQSTPHLRRRTLSKKYPSRRPTIFSDAESSTIPGPNSNPPPLIEPYYEDPFTSNANMILNSTTSPQLTFTTYSPTITPSPSIPPPHFTNPDYTINSNSNNNLQPNNNNNEDDTDFREFIAFIGWYAFLILCCILPTLCTYYKRRRNAYLLQENISNIRRRLEEMERYSEHMAVSGAGAGNFEGGEDAVVMGNRDWEFLEELFAATGSSSTDGVNHYGRDTANTTTTTAATAAAGLSFVALNSTTEEERRRQIMSAILGGMSVRVVMEREQRRKRERGRRLVSLLKECSLWVTESHLIWKEGVSLIGGNAAVMEGGGGDNSDVNTATYGEGEEGDIELGNRQAVHTDMIDGVDCKQGGEDGQNNDVEELSHDAHNNSNDKTSQLTCTGKSDEREEVEEDGRDDEEESCQQTTLDVKTSANTSQSTGQTMNAIDADTTTAATTNNLLSLYQTDDLYLDDDDDDDCLYSGLCVPCNPTPKDVTTISTIPSTTSAAAVAQSPPPQSTIDHESSTRIVPPTCAICLLSYSPGCYVTWSSNPECIHVFHRDCILVWLLKKEEPLCPCCRREFVPTSILNEEAEDTTVATTATSTIGGGGGGVGIEDISRLFTTEDTNRLDQRRRASLLLERSQMMASRRASATRRPSNTSRRPSNTRRPSTTRRPSASRRLSDERHPSRRFRRLSSNDSATTLPPRLDSVGLGRARHF